MSQRPGRIATLVAASLFVTSSWAAAQAVTTGIIEGRVADQSGGVLPGATVTLRSPTRNTAVTQTTGANGEFKFLALQVGTYELKAELAGFSTISISDVTVNPGSNQRFPLQMKVGSFEEAILVTADSPLINTKDAAESTTLNDKYLSTLPLITRNYTEMPTVFPGVSYSRGARTSYNQFNVRGGDQTGNNYLLDGGSLNRGVGRAGILIAPSVIERVEFLPGGFSAEYGGYQSSVINLISKSGANTADFFLSAISKPNFLLSSIDTGLRSQVRDKPLGWAGFVETAVGGPIVKGRFWYFTGFQYNAENQGTVLSADPLPIRNRFYPAHLKLTYQKDPNNRWEYTGDAGPFTADHTNLSTEIAAESNRRQAINTWNQTARHTHLFNSRTVVESGFQVFFMSFHNNRIDDDVPISPGAHFVRFFDTAAGHFYTSGPSPDRFGVLNETRGRLSTKVTRTAGPHTLKAGVEWSESFGRQPRLREVPNFNDLRAQPGGGVLTRQDPYAVKGSLRDRSVGGFLQDNWVAAPTVTVDAGIRFDTQRRSTTGVAVSPRGGLTWDPMGNGQNKLFASVGRYYSNVFDSVFGFSDSRPEVDITYLVRNADANLVGQDTVRSIQRFAIDDLESPYINHASVGYEHLVTPDLKVGITGVVRRGHNQPSSDAVTVSSVEVLQVQRTAGTLRYNGLELVLQKAPRHRFEGLLSYTIGKAEDEASGVLSPLQRRFSFGPADYDQRRTFTGTGTITFPGDVSYTTLLRYASGRPFSIVNGDPTILAAYVDRTGQITGRNQEQLPANWTLDMTVGHEFGSTHGRVRLFGQVINATNRVNVIAVSTQLVTAGAATNVDIPRQIQLGIELRY
ncbi:MAG: hypothetical protein DMF95_09485 [Acidobacteria bacterium]|nr:MAG: hypothetical protein DMF95_09485 [Acidobacteriota bacterium]